MICLLLATAAAEPLTITTETGDLQADEVHILELDEDGNIVQGPSLQDVIDSNFATNDSDWSAGVGALHSFHRELGESQTNITADVGHILGTEDGARSCTCPRPTWAAARADPSTGRRAAPKTWAADAAPAARASRRRTSC